MPNKPSELKPCPFCGGEATRSLFCGRDALNCDACGIVIRYPVWQRRAGSTEPRTTNRAQMVGLVEFTLQDHYIGEHGVPNNYGYAREAERIVTAYLAEQAGKDSE